MSIVAAVFDVLRADVNVTGVVGDRLRPEFADPHEPRPYIYAALVTENDRRDLDGVQFAEATVEVNCVADTYAMAHSLATHVRRALRDFTGAAGDYIVDDCELSNYLDSGEREGESIVRRVSLDFSIRYREG